MIDSVRRSRGCTRAPRRAGRLPGCVSSLAPDDYGGGLVGGGAVAELALQPASPAIDQPGRGEPTDVIVDAVGAQRRERQSAENRRGRGLSHVGGHARPELSTTPAVAR